MNCNIYLQLPPASVVRHIQSVLSTLVEKFSFPVLRSFYSAALLLYLSSKFHYPLLIITKDILIPEQEGLNNAFTSLRSSMPAGHGGSLLLRKAGGNAVCPN